MICVWLGPGFTWPTNRVAIFVVRLAASHKSIGAGITSFASGGNFPPDAFFALVMAGSRSIARFAKMARYLWHLQIE